MQAAAEAAKSSRAKASGTDAISDETSRRRVAAAVSAHAIALTVAKMYTGFSFDKFGLRVTMLVCNLCAVVGITMLALVSNSTNAFIAEILTSFALPLETIMLPLITTELFGRKSYATLMGLTVSFNTLGYAVGTPLMNLFYDLTGTYSKVMIAMCGVMVVVAVIMQFVISAAHRERERVEQEEANV